ncbi:hypothetical protein NLX71_21085 [Paenibacillus sp. MZ04-78.2]|uniref:hypothetical protein n=1 Tax=Paenibacillus sp. MZ04-78.2 TaxID=2962034 RepID=UPI0020B717C4|nr:hypothetical protein [Paenibacillus sp. MZ04-78.2]MCP3775774.1 hypothetical protein [Paenibacillus sp. MZ04-78.2]
MKRIEAVPEGSLSLDWVSREAGSGFDQLQFDFAHYLSCHEGDSDRKSTLPISNAHFAQPFDYTLL